MYLHMKCYFSITISCACDVSDIMSLNQILLCCEYQRWNSQKLLGDWAADLNPNKPDVFYLAHKKCTIFNCHLIIHPLTLMRTESKNSTEASYTHQIWCRGSLLILELISIVFVAAAAAAAASLQYCSNNSCKYEKTQNISFFH